MTPASLNWHGLGRRRFLRLLAAAGTMAGTSAVTTALVGCAAERPSLLVLDNAAAATIAAVADAVAPHGPGFPDVTTARVVDRLDEEAWFIDPSIQDDLRAAAALLEWLPLLYGRPGRFSQQDRATRQALLATMAASRMETVRAVATNFRLLTMFFYFGHSATWSAIGYDGSFGKLPAKDSVQRQFYAAKRRELA